MRLDGKVAAVTGGGSGIGRAICLRLTAEGARVAALDIDLAGAQETVDAAGDGVALVVDVSDSAAVDAAIAEVERSLGPLDILVNNAGAVGGAHLRRVTPLLETQRAEQAAGRVKTPLEALVRITDEEWRQLLAVHLDGTFHGTRSTGLSCRQGSGNSSGFALLDARTIVAIMRRLPETAAHVRVHPRHNWSSPSTEADTVVSTSGGPPRGRPFS